ncbi:signal peptide peptidase SppA [Bacillus subtilis]|uniref:signal peptide peptidase SppA n=1 Tax=Pseudochrobactrum asaccharolyticum TaxID=354351 RepID=UPI001F01BF76|nr:signal peptide peptidase SppA [Pseudochrobactrum asaccharolyticum]MCF7644353.1 signal peptide peptidase SppA [Pseudochrobactrum asaccharolyticum]MCF7670408.1 signal peptide peptidase SppA [Bacillus subtilis]
MTYTADAVLERRRIRRKLTFWRVITFILLAAIILFAAIYINGSKPSRNIPHIAKISITGTIYNNEELLKRLKDVADSEMVKGVILDVSSPGGTTTGGEVIYDAVRRIADEKPVVTQVGTLAASAGYMIAIASDHVIAHKTSMIGSIGVLFQYPDISGLLDKVGVKFETIKSSPLKAEPNFFSPASDEAKAMIDNTVKDTYDWFVGLVKERRPMIPADKLPALTNGSVYTGRQALQHKLIDALGDQETSIAWLASKGVDKNLPVVEWKAETSPYNDLLSSAALKLLLRNMGLSDQGSALFDEQISQRIFLDGMLSVWHGSGAEKQQ